MTVDAMLSSAYAAVGAASQRQEPLSGLILEAGRNPTPDSLSALHEAEVQASVSVAVEGVTLSNTDRVSGGQLGLLGRGFDRYV